MQFILVILLIALPFKVFSEDFSDKSQLVLERLNQITSEFEISDRVKYIEEIHTQIDYAEVNQGNKTQARCDRLYQSRLHGNILKSEGELISYDKEDCIRQSVAFSSLWVNAGIPPFNSPDQATGQTHQAYLREVEEIISSTRPEIKSELDKIKNRPISANKLTAKKENLQKIKDTYALARKVIGIYNPNIEDAKNLDINYKLTLSVPSVYKQKVFFLFDVFWNLDAESKALISSPSLLLSLENGYNRMVCRHMAKVLADFLNYVFNDVVAKYRVIDPDWNNTDATHAVVELNHDSFSRVVLDITNANDFFAPFDEDFKKNDNAIQAAILKFFKQEAEKSSFNYCEHDSVKKYMESATFDDEKDGQILKLKINSSTVAEAKISYDPRTKKAVCEYVYGPNQKPKDIDLNRIFNQTFGE